MVNKTPPKTTLINTLILIFVINVILHIIIFGTGIKFLLKNGINQIIFGSKIIQISSFADLNFNLRIYSFFAIVLELILIFFFLFIDSKNKDEFVKEMRAVKKLKTEFAKSKNQTDLDVLYNILKERKKIKVSILHTVFDVDRETMRDWIETLESGDLVELNNKKFGESELIFKK